MWKITICGALLVAVIGLNVAVYRSGWTAGRAEIVATQATAQRQQQQKVSARQTHDDAKAITADTEGREKAKTITREVVRYVKTVDRTECRFPDRRVSIKRAAADNANSIRGYDAPAVQDGAAER